MRSHRRQMCFISGGGADRKNTLVRNTNAPCASSKCTFCGLVAVFGEERDKCAYHWCPTGQLVCRSAGCLMRSSRHTRRSRTYKPALSLSLPHTLTSTLLRISFPALFHAGVCRDPYFADLITYLRNGGPRSRGERSDAGGDDGQGRCLPATDPRGPIRILGPM